MAQIWRMSGPVTIQKSSARDAIATGNLFLPADGSPPVEWRISDGLTDYETAVAEMEARAGAIRDGDAPELVWLEPAPIRRISSRQTAFPSSRRAAAANSPITVPASASPMSCST